MHSKTAIPTLLAKGGLRIETSIGAVQFGAPPETLKDSFEIGVPQYYIVPRTRFDWANGISLLEFEFPVYYNYFFRGRTRTKLICDAAAARQIAAAFQETLLGPSDLSRFAADFETGYAAAPRIERELAHFAFAATGAQRPTALGDFIEFVLFDVEGVARVGGVRVERRGARLALYDGDALLCEFEDSVALSPNGYPLFAELARDCPRFAPPAFGVTTLGSSHGFDCAGSTSGFVLWLNGRGVAVDPPPFAARALRDAGVPAELLDVVLVSHCHADHDAGAMHWLLACAPATLVSTPTVLQSFVRKHAALCDVSAEALVRCFRRRAVRVGRAETINGARFRFEYALHSIPALSFSVELNGRSLFFSGDTLYEPAQLRSMCESGVLSDARWRSLAERDFAKYDIALHEAGVPPIHTPIAALSALSAAAKAPILLYHIAERDVSDGFRVAAPGLARTVALAPPNAALGDLEFALRSDLAAALSPLCLFDCLRERVLRAGERVNGDAIFLVKNGICAAENGQNFCVGNFFAVENAVCVRATEPTKLIEIGRESVDWICGESALFSKIAAISQRRAELERLRKNNAFLAKLDERALDAFSFRAKRVDANANEILWKTKSFPLFCFLVISGDFRFRLETAEQRIEVGAFAGDFPALCNDESETQCEAICQSDGAILRFERDDFRSLLKRVPILYIFCRDRFVLS